MNFEKVSYSFSSILNLFNLRKVILSIANEFFHSNNILLLLFLLRKQIKYTLYFFFNWII